MINTTVAGRLRHIVLAAAVAATLLLPTEVAFAQKTPRCGSVTDSNPHPPLNYSGFFKQVAYPRLVNHRFTDPVFGCTIKRLTNGAMEGIGSVTHPYSSVNPFNADASLVLLLREDGGIAQIRDLKGAVVRDNLNTLGIQISFNPVWSRTDPNILYYVTEGTDGKQNRLKSYNVATQAVTLLNNGLSLSHPVLGPYQSVRIGWGEGDISWDGANLPMMGCFGGEYCSPLTDIYMFAHNISDATSTAPVGILGQRVNNTDMLPSNRMVSQRELPIPGQTDLYGQNGQPAATGIIDHSGHWDRGRDSDGTDMFVIDNSNDLNPIPGCPNVSGHSIVKFRIPASAPYGPEQCLQTMAWTLATHISCNNVGQDWCLVSVYSMSATNPSRAAVNPSGLPNTEWPAYANELLMVKLDPSLPVRTYRLAHTRSSGSGWTRPDGWIDYQKVPRASVSADGRYVLFDSDMADCIDKPPSPTDPEGFDTPGYACSSESRFADVYLLRLPERIQWLNPVTDSGNDRCVRCADIVVSSRQQITSGDGYVEFTAPGTMPQMSIGLSSAHSERSCRDMDYLLRLLPGQPPAVFENCVWKAQGRNAVEAGDVLRVAIVDGEVQYSNNGSVFHSHAVTPAYPLAVFGLFQDSASAKAALGNTLFWAEP